MCSIKTAPIEKESFKLSKWIDTSATLDFNNISNSFQVNKKNIRNVKAKIWSKRLELFFGFIPALLVFFITYGKKFR